MCWQCDNPDKTLDDYLDLLRGKILANGWAVQYVEDRRPFAYTIGLHDRGLPELLVTGLEPRQSLWLLNTFARRALVDGTPKAGNQVRLPAGTHVEVVEVDRPDAHLYMAVNIEGPKVEAVQLVWADGRGRWPWVPGFDDGRRPQPVFGKRAA
jgi:Domain of unknown function (DUF4262)